MIDDLSKLNRIDSQRGSLKKNDKLDETLRLSEEEIEKKIKDNLVFCMVRSCFDCVITAFLSLSLSLMRTETHVSFVYYQTTFFIFSPVVERILGAEPNTPPPSAEVRKSVVVSALESAGTTASMASFRDTTSFREPGMSFRDTTSFRDATTSFRDATTSFRAPTGGGGGGATVAPTSQPS